MLRNAKVAEYIQKRMQDRQKRTEITQDRVLQELAAIAFAKTTDYAEIKNECVRIKDTGDLDEQQVRAIAGIKKGKFGVEIKLNDKEKALELLGRHFGMFKDKVEVSGLEEEKKKLGDILEQLRGDG
nr:MAG TPA: Terminase small subunit [Caudoviricetes sp.]